eukprot:1447334-Pleurochrysis_carterae.AAC.1
MPSARSDRFGNAAILNGSSAISSGSPATSDGSTAALPGSSSTLHRGPCAWPAGSGGISAGGAAAQCPAVNGGLGPPLGSRCAPVGLDPVGEFEQLESVDDSLWWMDINYSELLDEALAPQPWKGAVETAAKTMGGVSESRLLGSLLDHEGQSFNSQGLDTPNGGCGYGGGGGESAAGAAAAAAAAAGTGAGAGRRDGGGDGRGGLGGVGCGSGSSNGHNKWLAGVHSGRPAQAGGWRPI